MNSLCGMLTNVYITCFSITEVKKIHVCLASTVDGNLTSDYFDSKALLLKLHTEFLGHTQGEMTLSYPGHLY